MRRLVLALTLLPGPALAQLPPPGCYARDYDAAHLAAHPGQGVAGLRLWFFAEDRDGNTPAALVEARMAAQGQATRDGVADRVLTQYAVCDPTGACYVECDGGSFATEPLADGGLRITTAYFRVGEDDSCAGPSDLAEAEAPATTYLLAAAPDDQCRALWQPHELPAPGCYGIDYSDMVRGQGLLGLRLLMHPADQGFAFAQAMATLRVTLPDGGRARDAGLGGARIGAPVWCSGRDGLCRSGVDEGAFRVVPQDGAVALLTNRFLVFGAGASQLDIAQPGGVETRHLLRPLPDDACRGME